MKLINLFILIFVLLNFIYLSNAQKSECDTCLSEGEKCMIQSTLNDNTYYREQSCLGGLFCGPLHFNDNKGDYVCRKLIKENERCSFYVAGLDFDSCEVGLNCVGGYCNSGSYAMIGDNCKYDSDCDSEFALCIEGTCQRFNNTCISNSECIPNFYCPLGQCIPILKLNEVCANDNDCSNGLGCIRTKNIDGSQSNLRTCQYPQKLGEGCSHSSECDQKNDGLYCSSSSNKCEKYFVPMFTNCTLSGCDEFHSCSSCDGKCYQSSLLPTQYLEKKQPLLDCMEKSNCTFNSLYFNRNFESSESCISKHCGAEYCNSLRGVSTDNNPKACQRNYYVNTYCSRYNSTNSSDSSDSSNPSNSSKLSISIFSLIIIVLVGLLI